MSSKHSTSSPSNSATMTKPQRSSLLFHISQETAPTLQTMAPKTCPSCSHILAIPPSVGHLLTTCPPSVTPLYGINRKILRCKHCDLMVANKKAIDAELPPPTYVNMVTTISRHIEDTKRLIEYEVRKEELEGALSRMRVKLREAVRERDDGIRKAWEEYWGVWGPEESGIGSLLE